MDANCSSESLTEMKTYPINIELKLSEEDISRLVFHSALNLVDVLQDLIGSVRVCLNGRTDVFKKTEAFCTQLGRSLGSFSATARLMQSFTMERSLILGEVEDVKQILAVASQANAKLVAKVQGTMSLLENFIVPIFELRMNELLQRSKYPAGFWVAYHIATLRRNMETVLQAVSLSNAARTRIVFKPEEMGPQDHLVQLDIQSAAGRSIRLPPVMQDCFRDLLMNARKYSLPGTTIRGLMANTGEELVIRVEDQGIGIEPDEVEQIIQFGFRGSNAIGRRTMGGGFGLTKAYYFTKLLGGTFTITTGLGMGSIFEIRIRCPPGCALASPVTAAASAAAPADSGTAPRVAAPPAGATVEAPRQAGPPPLAVS
ncbi:putative ATP-binding protein [Paratrimastix pyriformis]|uniref:histidine kinase n=1 Tax=Paratrimastix pyriformis TaxID=342808 RepID=A0ABQ8UBC0_9EUKA|nr:putative ATP-binding protein [Paratrimastix pyriformis]